MGIYIEKICFENYLNYLAPTFINIHSLYLLFQPNSYFLDKK